MGTSKFAITAFNPHGEDGGNCGREEVDIIKPAVDALRAKSWPTPMTFYGPFPSDLEAGALVSMTGGGYPDGIRLIIEHYLSGRHDAAFEHCQKWLPLNNCENRQGGILTVKALMKEGGIIKCDAPRHPFPAINPGVRKGLIACAKRLKPLVLEG